MSCVFFSDKIQFSTAQKYPAGNIEDASDKHHISI